jgi:hypothetical protein
MKLLSIYHHEAGLLDPLRTGYIMNVTCGIVPMLAPALIRQCSVLRPTESVNIDDIDVRGREKYILDE